MRLRTMKAMKKRLARVGAMGRVGGWMVASAMLLSGGAAVGQGGPPASTQPSPAAPAPAASPAGVAAAQGGTISGTVKAGAVPLPGVAVTATNTLTGKKYTTTTDVNGAFSMTIARNGRYVVRAELAAFAAETKEILLNADGKN